MLKLPVVGMENFHRKAANTNQCEAEKKLITEQKNSKALAGFE